MHLNRLKIKNFRNLNDLDINFNQAIDQEVFHTHAVIGHNGTGKSNLVEALILIFRDLDHYNPSSLDYELTYTIRDHAVSLKGRTGQQPKVNIDGRDESAKLIHDNPNTYLPSHVFTYYSGKNHRIEELFTLHIEQFNKKIQTLPREAVPAHFFENFSGTPDQAEAIADQKEKAKKTQNRLGENLMRRLFFCREGHSQLVMLACLLSKDPIFTRLLQDLNIVELDSALFVLKRPHRLKTPSQKNLLEGDNRFWYAGGSVVEQFLDKLWQVAVAPIDHEDNKQIDFRGRSEKQDLLYLFVPDKEQLQELGDLVGPPDIFFKYAEGAYIGDLIEEVRIFVKHKDVNNEISFDQLSEGELQLLTVLGLMRITSQDHCLFLLDEPDTHLNPIWKLRYFDDIEMVIRQDEGKTLAGESHIIITTHDPMMIGSLKKEQVRILKSYKGKTHAEIPEEDPRGMGVSGLLKSEMFGLPSTLDMPTRRELHKRNELLAKKANTGLSKNEEKELKALKTHLDDLGFSKEYRDPLYQLFIEKLFEVKSLPLEKVLTPEELNEQEILAQKIITQLVKDERSGELSSLARELKIQMRGDK
jgi:predicted ATPase